MEEIDDSTAVGVIVVAELGTRPVVGAVIWLELSEMDDNIPLDCSVTVFVVLDSGAIVLLEGWAGGIDCRASVIPPTQLSSGGE